MKRIELTHDRIFYEKSFADGYYKRNARNIKMVSERFVSLLRKAGFEGKNILDTGCGFGTMDIEIAKAFPDTRIIAVDLSEPLLEKAAGFAQKEQLSDRIDFRAMDVHQLSFGDDSYDLVLNSFMLHIVDDPIAMLNEIERVTRPDGKIMITDLRRMWLGAFMKKIKASYTLEEAVEIIVRSSIRKGKAGKGPFWWDYMVL